MLKGISLVDLARKIEANKELKHDMIADTSALTMQVQSDKTIVLETPDQTTYPVRPIAHGQIGDRLGIPAKYYDRMKQEAPDLLATNVNAWFRKEPEKRLVRTLGGDVRAFLSNRYQRIENEEIAEVALPILFDIPDVQVVSCEITEKRLYIQATTPRVKGEVKVGDEVQAGVIISNSEVGFGAVSVASMIYRLRCLNGMVGADRFRANHVGRKIEDNEALWADDTRQADDRAVLLKVRDMVRNAVDETRFREQLAKMAALTEGKIEGNPTTAIEVLSKKIGATENESGGILRALIEGGDLTRWGILNAVTAQAHTAKDYDRAVDFEVIGGKLLELPKHEWKEILTAA